ncbi:hypothetical protein B0H16DRAFT_1694969 [Mycena metata]|uniref:Uncharacterized protein n=1 Tax=Mycena metata TaxID=1033252 RepID=A0AAD7IB05_9AGAR|nr:hypothetical protein B0H16DRAFT_1694969 [Mycena metata]
MAEPRRRAMSDTSSGEDSGSEIGRIGRTMIVGSCVRGGDGSTIGNGFECDWNQLSEKFKSILDKREDEIEESSQPVDFNMLAKKCFVKDLWGQYAVICIYGAHRERSRITSNLENFDPHLGTVVGCKYNTVPSCREATVTGNGGPVALPIFWWVTVTVVQQILLVLEMRVSGFTPKTTILLPLEATVTAHGSAVAEKIGNGLVTVLGPLPPHNLAQ